MEFFENQVPLILLALVTGYIGFQFNSRTKKREFFIKALTASYNLVYSPMYEHLQNITNTLDKQEKINKLEHFFECYSGTNTNTNIRYIGSSFLLEFFYDFRLVYQNFRNDRSRKNESELLDKLNEFFVMIEDEYWDAHDIIYEDHLQFKDTIFLNPFISSLLSFLRGIYYLVSFSVWISMFILYFTTYAHFVRNELLPEWWSLSSAALLLVLSLMLFAITLSFRQFVIKKNRRKNKLIKKFTKKLFKIFRR